MKGRTKSFISSLFCFGLGIVPVMADAGANHTGSTLQVTQQAKRSLSGTVTDATPESPYRSKHPGKRDPGRDHHRYQR